MNGLADVQDCLITYVKTLKADCPLREAIEFLIDRHNRATGPNLSHSLNVGYIMPNRTGFFVSGTELLKCHAFTDCLLFVCLPKGVRPDTFCSPRGNFQILLQIPLHEKAVAVATRALPTTLTPLGTNRTQVADLSATAEERHEEKITFPEKKTDGNEVNSTIVSLEGLLLATSHLPAVRISDECDVQTTAEWTHPPPGLECSRGDDDDPIESFSRSPSSYHQPKNN